jgi:hypothetical protein
MVERSARDWSQPLAADVRTVALAAGNGALVVRPAAGCATDVRAPGILWLHWLGHNRGDCTEFLAEAVALAGEGVVSVLPQGTFPWSEQPTGQLTDSDQVASELQRVRQALWTLRTLPEVDPGRIAIVGHDYGAMYGLALEDPGVKLFVAATPDSGWSRWFRKYWPVAEDATGDYDARLDAFDPLEAAAGYGDRLRLQWAESDEYVPDYVRDVYALAAPRASSSTYAYDHQLGHDATRDRLSWLRDALEVGRPASSGDGLACSSEAAASPL